MNRQKLRLTGGWLLREWIRPLVPILLIVTAFRSAVADWSDVPTGSMKLSIVEGDRVFINKLAYSLRFPLTRWHLLEFGDPQRGDVVVFISPHDSKRLVKRVVAIAGDTVELRNNVLHLNGEALNYSQLNITELPVDREEWNSNWRLAGEQLSTRPHPVMSRPEVVALRSFGPIRVPSGSVFVMGDNRDDSFDSRYFGPVDRDCILGEATHIALSFNPHHYYLPRWRRFFEHLP